MDQTVLAIEHIVSTPGVMGGKPRIAGHRVSVENIAVLHAWHQWSVIRITEELGLTIAQVHAALSYYYDHQEEIDRLIAEGEEAAKAVGISSDELKRQIEGRRKKP